MINEIYEFSDKIEKLLTALRIKFIVELIIIFIIGFACFKLIELFDRKLKEKLNSGLNSSLARFVHILSNIFWNIHSWVQLPKIPRITQVIFRN